MKCVCDACGCVFLHDGQDPDSQTAPISYSKVAPEFNDLSDNDKSRLHDLLAAVARRPNYLSYYIFVELGNLWVLTFLTHHGWISGDIKSVNDTYCLTDAGADALIALNAERGDPILRQHPPTQDGG